MSDKERLEQIKNKKFFDVGNGDLLNLKDVNWLIEQAEKAEKYREALEFYAGGNHYSDKLYDDKVILLDNGETARKALER